MRGWLRLPYGPVLPTGLELGKIGHGVVRVCDTVRGGGQPHGAFDAFCPGSVKPIVAEPSAVVGAAAAAAAARCRLDHVLLPDRVDVDDRADVAIAVSRRAFERRRRARRRSTPVE